MPENTPESKDWYDSMTRNLVLLHFTEKLMAPKQPCRIILPKNFSEFETSKRKIIESRVSSMLAD